MCRVVKRSDCTDQSITTQCRLAQTHAKCSQLCSKRLLAVRLGSCVADSNCSFEPFYWELSGLNCELVSKEWCCSLWSSFVIVRHDLYLEIAFVDLRRSKKVFITLSQMNNAFSLQAPYAIIEYAFVKEIHFQSVY